MHLVNQVHMVSTWDGDLTGEMLSAAPDTLYKGMGYKEWQTQGWQAVPRQHPLPQRWGGRVNMDQLTLGRIYFFSDT